MNKLYTAIAAFQQEVPVIHKGTQGYGYSYADLPAILSIINPLMAKHGLGFTQMMTELGLETTIFHCASGEKISSITYMRRYALSSALGLVTDKDTDASGEQIKPGIDAELVNKLAKCKDITELQMLYSTKEDWTNAEKTLFTNRKKSLK
jgi:hypothetical protein